MGKAFDNVSRRCLWQIIFTFGCPDQFITMVWQSHDDMQARAENNGEYSKPFPVSNGGKLAPTLFNLMITAMLKDAFRGESVGVVTISH